MHLTKSYFRSVVYFPRREEFYVLLDPFVSVGRGFTKPKTATSDEREREGEHGLSVRGGRDM